jgi:hypothetical protein
VSNERVLPEIINLIKARRGRLLWHHCTDSRHCEGHRGLPDLLIVGRRVLYREVKPSRHVRLEPDQVTWKYSLIAAGANYAVWGREQVDDGTVERELDAIAGVRSTPSEQASIVQSPN